MITEIVFEGLLPGLNGKGGLLRMHWVKKGQLAKRLSLLIMSQTRNKHAGQVTFSLVRYSMAPKMDFDNLVATSKIPTDCLVKTRVIADDNPDIIVSRAFTHVRVKTKGEQRTVITITDYNEPIYNNNL